MKRRDFTHVFKALPAVLLLLPVFNADALDPNRAITQYVHDVWQTEQGLPVHVEEVIVDQELFSGSAGMRKVELAPGKKNFEFHYTGLSLVAPEKVLFQYKLDGFDRDWVDALLRCPAAYGAGKDSPSKSKRRLSPGEFTESSSVRLG